VLGASLLVDTLDALERGSIAAVEQEDALATYAPKLTKDDGRIDWTLTASQVHNRVRGLHPWPQAFTFLGPTRLAILRGRAAPGTPAQGAAPGTVVSARGDQFLVAAAGDSVYQLIEVQPDGRRPMTARAFLAGHPIAPSTRLGV
jgi:methionyl-tRNA formyltransferase